MMVSPKRNGVISILNRNSNNRRSQSPQLKLKQMPQISISADPVQNKASPKKPKKQKKPVHKLQTIPEADESAAFLTV